MTQRRLISSGSPFERLAGYSRAVVQGPWCFVAGTTGLDPITKTYAPDVTTQAHTAMNIVTAALKEAGFSLSDVVRANYIVADPYDVDAVSTVVGNYFADIRPAATMIVAGLIRPEMKVEIEVTALKTE